jgi:2-oxoglutarate ferredoxin oxidoreductase subunit gamma
MLGAVIGLTGIVKTESIMKVLGTKIPRGFLDMNKQALDLGFELAEASAVNRG